MQLLKRWRLGRGVVAVGAGVLLIAGLATPAAAATQQFNVNVVGGSIQIGSTAPNDLGGDPACSNGTDDEYDPIATFANPTDTKDGQIDYPADPQCATPFDNNERVAGFQQPVPISMSGTIDDGTGAFSVPAGNLVFPATTLTVTSPLPTFISNATTADSTITGTMAPGGTVSFSSLDLSFAIQLCIPAFGCASPPPPHGTGPGWTANCIVDVNPPNVTSSDPGGPNPGETAGSPYFGAAGVATVADTDFTIPAPTDAVPAGAVSCPALAGSFGLPSTTSDLSLLLSTNKAIGQAKSITVGNGSAYEVDNLGKTKITFPVTVFPAPATDMTIVWNAAGLTATENTVPALPPNTADFSRVDNKVLTIKAGKTASKLAVTVLPDTNVEADELLLASISHGGALSDPSYQIVHGSALGTIKDETGAGLISVLGGDTPEGSKPSVVPPKPSVLNATFPVVLSTPQATDTFIQYCTQDVTASANVLLPKPAQYKDYGGVSCAAPKVKKIAAGKQSTAITVPINQDGVKEPDEAFAVVLLGVTGSPATINPAASVAVGQIKTDD